MDSFNPIEKEVFDYLKRSPTVYISASEVSKNVGNRKWFNADKNWARAILRRLEMDGWLESNPFGEYRVKTRALSETSFRDALGMAGMSLGDTAIITSDEAKGRG